MASWIDAPGGAATSVSDTDRILIDQDGVSRSVTRGQFLEGVQLRWEGDWSDQRGYAVNASLRFNGSVYYCIAPTNAGESPGTNPEKWQLLSSKGDQGDAGSIEGETIHPADIITTGPWLDARAHPTLAAADAAAVAAGAQLRISTQWDVVPAELNAYCKFLPGGKLNNAGSVVMRVPEAGNHQIFIGAGSVKFIYGTGKKIPAAWFGQKGDLATNSANDDTAAILKALASLARTNGADYFRASTVLILGHSRCTGRVPLPYGVGLEGDSPGNSGLFFDTDVNTDGVVADAAISNPGGSFMYDGFLKDIMIASVSPTTSRDLVVLNGVANFDLQNVRIVGAGARNLVVQDCVNIRGRRVMATGAKLAGLWIGTAGSSVCTTTSFTDSFFINTTHGPGADVAGIGLGFDNCYFEYNGATDGIGGGVKVRQGTVTLNAPYFEGNAGHYMEFGTDTAAAQANGNFTVINPTLVKNPISPAGDKYGLRANAALSLNLIGGDYAKDGNTIFINTTNVAYMNTVGVTCYPSTVVASPGTLDDVKGMLLLNDPATGAMVMHGNMQHSIGGGTPIKKVYQLTIPDTNLGTLADGASLYFDFLDSSILKYDTATLQITGVGIGAMIFSNCDAYAAGKFRIKLFNKNGAPLDLSAFTGKLTCMRM